MAITGKHNVLQLVRMQKAPYWKLYQSDGKRQAGNFINQADFNDSNLDIEASVESLRWTLDTLTTGLYHLTAWTTKDKTKGGIDTTIEIDGNGSRVAAIGAVDNGFHIDGFGRVTSENFSEAITTKMKAMLEEQRKEQELANLKAENARLQKELNESESGFKKGVISIGSVLYDNIKETPSGKEFIGMAQKVLFGINKASASQQHTVDAKAEVVSTSAGDDDDRLAAACERLAANNPQWLEQLEKLAKLKENDPGTFEMAVDSLNSTT